MAQISPGDETRVVGSIRKLGEETTVGLVRGRM